MDILTIRYKGPLMMVFLPIVFMASDMLIGFLAAASKQEIVSTKMRSGLMKKVCLLTSLLLVIAISEMTNIPSSVSPLVSSYICLCELISIIENLKKAGIKIPKFVTYYIEKNSKYIGGDSNDKDP